MTLADLKNLADAYVIWLKAHEKLALIAVAALLLFHFGNSGLNAWIHHDETRSQIDAQKVVADATANKALADQVQKLTEQVGSQNAKLEAANRQRNAATQAQQTADQKMPLPDLALRWIKLIAAQPTDITPSNISDQLVIDGSAAHATVDSLELVPTLKADNTNLQMELSGEKQIVAKQSEQVTGLQGQLTDEQASHKADVATEKAKAKRSFWRGFKFGFVAGAVSVEAIHIWAGRP